MFLSSFQENFFYFTLNRDDTQVATGVFIVIFFLLCAAAKSLYSDNPKRLAWALSTVNSLVLVVIGCAYMIIKAPTYYNFFFFGYDGLQIFHSIDNVSYLACLWFAIFLVYDLAFGMLYYRDHIGLLTGYVHHIAFFWVMCTSMTANGGFVQTETTFCSIFCFHLIEELPTFILALGSLYPQFRSDEGFGITFFMFRIVYHLYLLIYAYVVDVNTPLKCVYAASMLLHASWFYSWLIGYGNRILKKAEEQIKSGDLYHRD